MKRILIAEPTHNILESKLTNSGIKCEYIPELSIEELKDRIVNYTGLVIRSKFLIDENFADLGKNLDFIARAGSGMENICVEYCESKGIKCINSPEGNKDAVGEHALGMLLGLFNNINVSNNEIKNGIWDRKKNKGVELENKTIGIIGYGNTGSAFAKRLLGFNVNVLAYDKYEEGFSTNNVREVDINYIYNEADIISFHIPLNDETHYMFNNVFINKVQKPFYLINTSRGPIVKTTDLVNDLKSGKVKGACLDVLEYEKTSFENILSGNKNEELEYLTESKNVILTPHIAGSSNESYRKIAEVLADKIIDLYNKRH
ncbi:MAG: phosphoglycerate dehydrogenase [bacterium]|nr:phosphoglycerate dehydrogenase [bacterium]